MLPTSELCLQDKITYTGGLMGLWLGHTPVLISGFLMCNALFSLSVNNRMPGGLLDESVCVEALSPFYSILPMVASEGCSNNIYVL